MILIDSIYIHNSGGRALLEILINYTQTQQKDSYYFLIDSRLDKFLVNKIPADNYKILDASEKNRRKFYIQNKIKFTFFVCFSNVPPPITLKRPVIIYFHNDLILNAKNSNFGLLQRFKFYLKKRYIFFRMNEAYFWVVQSRIMKENLNKYLRINLSKIYIFPFFEKFSPIPEIRLVPNTFLYVASLSKNKNHKKLIQAFIEASLKTNKTFTLKLTLTPTEFEKISIETNYKKSNFELINLGVLKKESLIYYYQEANFLIYPSLKESFGLPLIEATNFSLKIIASDLPYVHEIIKPSLTFDPYSVESISKSILKAMETDNLPETKVLVENKLDNFMDFIISQDVQK